MTLRPPEGASASWPEEGCYAGGRLYTGLIYDAAAPDTGRFAGNRKFPGQLGDQLTAITLETTVKHHDASGWNSRNGIEEAAR